MAVRPLSTSDIGARAELLVCALLISLGYQVFRNVSPAGPADIVVFKNGKWLSIDCKAGRNARYRKCLAMHKALVTDAGQISFDPPLPSRQQKK